MSPVPLPDFAEELVSAMEALDAPRVDIPVIQPAEPFLDMAGEDLRRRIYLTENERGESLCLRPEFTIPVCLGHIAEKVGTPQRYAYLGQVFRQRREGGNEFYQAGIEDLGEPDIAAADARAMADAAALVRRLLPDTPLRLVFGDQALFEAVVAGLGLPKGWQNRLIHAFGDTRALAQMIAALSAPQQGGPDEGPVSELVAGGDVGALSAHITGVMEETGFSTHASRSPEEIAARLIEKSRIEATRLSDEALSALRRFLSLDCSAADAPAALAAFAGKTGLDISSALERFEVRQQQLRARDIDMAMIRWRAAFGRPLDYYTGLVFEISGGEDQSVLIGGGRYDRMMELLGAEEPIAAVGFSIWVDRIEVLRKAAAAKESRR